MEGAMSNRAAADARPADAPSSPSSRAAAARMADGASRLEPQAPPTKAISAEALPEALRLNTSEYLEALRAELRPATALEDIFVAEMARHAAAMDFSEAAESRVLRFGARHHELLLEGAAKGGERELEAMFAAAVTSNAAERTERFGQLHRRGFYRAYAQLQLLRCETGRNAQTESGAVFDDERACETYLLGRMQADPRRCPSCTKRKFHYLKSRRRWECAACGVQIGLRAGTVMERSPLPLRVWFQAILACCAEPQIALRELAERIGIRRLATVRGMLGNIRRAIESPDAERLLAGLHRLDRAAQPATGARLRQKQTGRPPLPQHRETLSEGS